MSKLNKEELLNWLDLWSVREIPVQKQAYQQIKEMIQKPEVTEEWIEEKAKELITMVANLYPHETSPCVIPKSNAKDFIRSLVEKLT